MKMELGKEGENIYPYVLDCLNTKVQNFEKTIEDTTAQFCHSKSDNDWIMEALEYNKDQLKQ